MSDPALGTNLAPARRPWPLWKKILLRAAIGAAIGIGVFVYHESQNHGNAGPSAAVVKAAAHAESCSDSGYQIRETASGPFETVYNCMISGDQTCVLYVNGLASDVTSEVSDDFSDTLGGNKPDCIKDS